MSKVLCFTGSDDKSSIFADLDNGITCCINKKDIRTVLCNQNTCTIVYDKNNSNCIIFGCDTNKYYNKSVFDKNFDYHTYIKIRSEFNI